MPMAASCRVARAIAELPRDLAAAADPLFDADTVGFRLFVCDAAICGIGFQTLSNSVISLDLTRIIAFDAIREWEAATHRLRCGVPEMGRNCELRSQGKKELRVCLNNRKGSVGHETHCNRHSRRRRARIDGFGRLGDARSTTSRPRASSSAASTPAWPALPRRTTRASGPASTSTSAARSRPRSSATPPR